MQTYVILYRFTALGRRYLRRSVEQAAEVRKLNEQRGFKIQGLYWTQGRYDLLASVEAPSEQALIASLVSVNEAGNVSSETMRAFTEAEMLEALGTTRDEVLVDPTAGLAGPPVPPESDFFPAE